MPFSTKIDTKGITVLVLAIIVGIAAWFSGFTLIALIAVAVIISIVIWQACDPFAEAAQWLGTTLRIPGSVRGATLDAIASSMPELFSGIFFVWVAVRSVQAGDSAALAAAGAEGYGSTIATCAGSAIYNMILIPASVALVVAARRKDKPIVEVDPEVLARDGVWFLVCEMLLLIFLYQKAMMWWMALVFIALYVIYILQLRRDAIRYQKERDSNEKDNDEGLPKDAPILFGAVEIPLNLRSAWIIIIISTIAAAAACYVLVEVTRETAAILNVPTFFVAVILAAAVSSVPDTFLSIGSAMRGDDSGAVSNAFGSNIFDICICLSIPLLVNSYLIGWQPVSMMMDGKPIPGLVGLRVLLWVLTAITLAIIWHRRQITKAKAYVMIGLYLVFVSYAVLGSLNIFNF